MPRSPDALAWLVEQGRTRVLPAVREQHLRLSDRLLTPVPVALRTHDAVAAGAYGAADAGLRGSAAALRLVARHGVGRRLDVTGRGASLLTAIDALDPRAPLGTPLAVRAGGHDVAPDASALRRAFPDAHGHVAVLVHGLLEDDTSWAGGAAAYPDVLAARTGATPVVVRYATGRAVGETGRELSLLLAALTDAWPVAVTRLSLVGHGMGGRVVQAAGRHGLASAADWPRLVRQVVLLGEPESGAPGEKLAHLTASLRRAAPLPGLAAGRSTLRLGLVTPTEWHGQEVTAVWGTDRHAVAPLPRADHHVVRRPGRPLLHDAEVGALLTGWLATRGPGMLSPDPTEGEPPDGRA